ncbi:hypothetical protein [Legionella parisiensis]|uniref:Uncharacterized protein n=1 Tax=Legionella parisiensis TaxID=45071 RepID=A0A1E5JKM8_9GAMM|nr:hypothetical protein [Legionella parisiensis]KTD43034.1 hypothetical protein Lpar_1011 [Legionella parisiensis]OEH45107.1 hypothetical protein lpari_03877 [Legionella parisiensis]STX77891.1 Uncharacterised protein [Legionella parisiensis]
MKSRKEKVKELAIAANKYARSVVDDKTGSSSSLEMNSRPTFEDQWKTHSDVEWMRKGIPRKEDLDKEIEPFSLHTRKHSTNPKRYGIRKQRQEGEELQRQDGYRSSVRQSSDDFLDEVTSIHQHKKGNCGEYASLALEHVVNHNFHNEPIYAEKYQLARRNPIQKGVPDPGGDHSFLVLGRDPKSAVDDPTKWGDSAYICDPWANKVYEAKDFFKESKAFSSSYTDGRIVNKTHDYDPKEHSLSPVKDFNTEYLSNSLNSDFTLNKQSYLEGATNLYARKSALLRASVESSLSDLGKISGSLNDPKRKEIIDNKITELNKLKDYLDEPKDFNTLLSNSQDAYTDRRVLENDLENSIRKFKEVMSVSKEEKNTLDSFWSSKNSDQLTKMKAAAKDVIRNFKEITDSSSPKTAAEHAIKHSVTHPTDPRQTESHTDASSEEPVLTSPSGTRIYSSPDISASGTVSANSPDLSTSNPEVLKSIEQVNAPQKEYEALESVAASESHCWMQPPLSSNNGDIGASCLHQVDFIPKSTSNTNQEQEMDMQPARRIAQPC